MATDVFWDAKLTFKPPSTLKVELSEKWTTIPVVRAVVGGSSTLRVLGLYDTHLLGRGLTVGGEFQQYDDAPPGGVIYANGQFGNKLEHHLNFQYWNRQRRLETFDSKGRPGQQIYLKSKYIRLIWDREWLNDPFPIRLGPVVKTYFSQSSQIQSIDQSRLDIESSSPTPKIGLGIRAVAGKIHPDNILLTGSKLIFEPVAEFNQESSTTSTGGQLEAFSFIRPSANWNYAFHLVAKMAASRELNAAVFVGGLDSVRGVPDGFMRGHSGIWSNLEARYLALQKKYLWLQAATFIDIGAVNRKGCKECGPSSATTTGVGVRFAIPQIKRFVIRADFAWSVQQPWTFSISAGMNQFFQPLKPLEGR